MRPKSAMFYVSKIEEVAKDCLDHVERRLESDRQFPGKQFSVRVATFIL